MKINLLIILLYLSVLVIFSCNSTKELNHEIIYNDSAHFELQNNFRFTLNNGKGFNHPTYVLWEEDMSGNYLRTLYITKAYASGIFGHQMVGDSVWMMKPGESHQPAALPYWSHKKGLLSGDNLIPSPEHPFVDAYCGATATKNFQFRSNIEPLDKNIRILFEVNQAWDWNYYWTNSKYSDNYAYKHSAQPSIIYAVTINNTDSIYYLNPIGHGDAKGESGKLFTDLSNITSAKEIFKSIKLEIKSN
ncbi:MAG: hypothetical protein AUJ98_09895 [Bacteroidetes bacterium CG2_30_33_31]|nr:MAG: hypothetical protein AUJ98_09895 [Bacteroidetes bacterium CG2_30_33_31]